MMEVEEIFEDLEEFEEWYEKVDDKIEEISDRYTYMIIGGLFGVLSVIVRVIGDLIAIQQYPGYHVSTHMISFLSASGGHTYFTFGLIISSILIIPYYFAVALIFKMEYKEEKKIIQSSLYVSIISAVALSLVGLFLELATIIPNQLIYDIHGLFAAIAFACAVFACIVMGRLIQKSTYFPRYFAYACYIVAIVNFTFLFTWYCVFEWLASTLVILLQLTFGLYMIFKKVKSKLELEDYQEELDQLLIKSILMETLKK